MRVAALYDIHGNLPALEAVIDEFRQVRPDRVIVGGDVIPGPMPTETFELLNRINIPIDFIHGNCEVAVLDHLAGKVLSSVPEQARDAIEWTAKQLTLEVRR
jgi:predicted phosphodiesterase